MSGEIHSRHCFAAHVGGELVAQHLRCGDGVPDPHRAVDACGGEAPVGAMLLPTVNGNPELGWIRYVQRGRYTVPPAFRANRRRVVRLAVAFAP
jgi:hypothetical protein